MNLPKRHPQYGGTLTYYKDLEVGTEFYVCNGAWNGKIIEVDGVKKLYVEETEKVHDITDARYDWLSISEPKEKYPETPEHNSVRDESKGEAMFSEFYDYLNEIYSDIDYAIYSELFDKVGKLYEHFIEYAS